MSKKRGVLVWSLFAHAIDVLGPTPTVIEWDADVPSWPELHAEAERADSVMFGCGRQEARVAAAG